MKKCTKCKIEKELNKFTYISGLKKNGKFTECKKCRDNYFKSESIKIRGLEHYNKYVFETFKGLLRSRTYSAFKNKGYKKSSKTQEMLGVDWEVCKAHIERQFKERMNWGNQGEWHIDHIIPLSSVNTQKELTTLCNYQNLQPLWAKDNIEKSAKYNEIDKVNMIKKIKDSLIQKVSQVIEK